MKYNELEKKLIENCEFYHCDLVIRHYGTKEVCFTGITDEDEELFNVCLGYRKNIEERYIKFDVNTEREKWIGYSFTKDDILTLLELDGLTDNELHLKPFIEEDK